MGKRTYIYISCFIALPASAAFIGEQGQTVPPVYVTGAKKSYHSVTNGPKTVITRQQIKSAGVGSLTQALQNLGGVQLQDTIGNGSRVAMSMRGFGSNASSNTLLLVNGIPITNPDLAPPDLNAIPIHEIEYIEIIAGSESVLYGDQAVGGTINVVTREQFKEKADLACGYGSFNQRNCIAALHHSYKQATIDIALASMYTNNYRDNNDFSQHYLLGRFAFPHQTGQFSFDYKVTKENMRYPGALTAAEVRQNRRQAKNETDFFRDWNGLFHIKLQRMLNADWRIDTDLVHRKMNGAGVLTSPFTQSRSVYYLKPQIKGKLGHTAVATGVDYQDDRYDLTSSFGSTYDKEQKYGGFALANTLIYPKTTLALGARGALQHAYLRSFSINDNTNRAIATTIGLSYQLTPELDAYLRRAGSFRFPKADENAAIPPGVMSLRTQRGIAYETGVHVERGNNVGKIGIYQLNLEDEIAFDPTQTPLQPFGTNRNLDPTVRRGFTLSGKHGFSERLTLDGQYNYVNARFQSGANSGKRIPLVSENILRAGLDYTLIEGCHLYTETVFTGNQYAANDDANVTKIIGGYPVYNVNLRYERGNFNVALRVNNIFNKYYYFYTVYQPSMNSEYFYPAPGRNFTLTANYSFA